MDSVIEFEVVLANGSILTASSTNNVDLFNVLRGGGNNFGIVTAFTVKARPMGSVRIRHLLRCQAVYQSTNNLSFLGLGWQYGLLWRED